MREHLQELADSMTEILKVIREHGTPTINAHATIINKAHIDLFYAKKKLGENEEKIHWVSVDERLPEVIFDEDDCCNVVLVRYTYLFAPDAGSRYQTSNTIYLNTYPSRFTHWAYITEPEEE